MNLSQKIERAVDIINEEIYKRGITDFVSEFADTSETSLFVNKCVDYNVLDINRVNEYQDGAKKDFIHNILVQWVGLPYEQADEMVGFVWNEPLPSITDIKNDILSMLDERYKNAPDFTCFGTVEYGIFRVEAYKDPNYDPKNMLSSMPLYSFQIYTGKEGADNPLCEEQMVIPMNGTFKTIENYCRISNTLYSVYDKIVQEYNKSKSEKNIIKPINKSRKEYEL